MAIFGRDVPGSLGELQAGINRLFEQVWHSGIRTGPFDGQDCAPAVDVVEKADRYVVEIELPGVSRQDIDVSCSVSALTIKGQKVHSAVRQEGDHVMFAERRYGSFSRVVQFDEAVKSEKMTAKLENGVLLVSAPKKTVSTPQAVSIPIED